MLHPAQLSLEIEGRSPPDKQKLKEFLATNPALQEMLKETPSGKERPHARVSRVVQKQSELFL